MSGAILSNAASGYLAAMVRFSRLAREDTVNCDVSPASARSQSVPAVPRAQRTSVAAAGALTCRSTSSLAIGSLVKML